MLNIIDESDLNSNTDKTATLAPYVSWFKNHVTNREIRDRQGFHPREASKNNLKNLKTHLREGAAYIHQHIKSGHDNISEIIELYPSSDSFLGITKEEAVIFKLITENLTLKHATQLTDITLGDSLKSVRARELEGEVINNSRTGNHFGRQHFIYFVGGIGEHPNTPGLHGLATMTINLNQLAADNPQKLEHIHFSPHLSEFDNNACAAPILLGDTKVEMQCLDETKNIVYTITRMKEGVVLEKSFHLNEFVFYGQDIFAGIAYRFIELLRFVGNPFRQHLFSQITDDNLSNEQKIVLLSSVMAGLMPADMVLEAKIPEQIKLDARYSKIDIPACLIKKEEETEAFSYDCNPFRLEEGKLSIVDDALFINALINAVPPFPLTSKEMSAINKRGLTKEKFILDAITEISTEEVWNGSTGWEALESTHHLPSNLSQFFKNTIFSKSSHAKRFFSWMLTAAFPNGNEHVLYLLNMNERDHTGTIALIPTIIGKHSSSNEEKLELLEKIIARFNPLIFSKNFSYYVAMAMHETFDRRLESDMAVVDYLLGKNINLSDNDSHLAQWFVFSNNEKLLVYLFETKKMDINGRCDDYSYVEHAIRAENFKAVQWMINRGADLMQCRPDILAGFIEILRSPAEKTDKRGFYCMQRDEDETAVLSDIAKNVSLDEFPVTDMRPTHPDAVVLIVTGKTYDKEDYVVLGRRRLTHETHSQLEKRWSCPGGIVDSNETPIQAGIRELAEETDLKLDLNSMDIKEVARIPLKEDLKNEVKIENIIFLHIDMGSSKQAVYSGSDLAGVTKVRVNSLSKHFHLRQSNELILRDILSYGEIQPSTLTILPMLIDIELAPDSFINKKIDELIELRLKLADKDEISNEEEIFDMISLALSQPHLPFTKKSDILYRAMEIGDIRLVKLCLEKGLYDISDNHGFYLYRLESLLENKHFDMLELIRIEMSALFHQSDFMDGKKLLDNVKKLDKNPVTEKIVACIEQQNCVHKLTLLLTSISSIENRQDTENGDKIKDEILAYAADEWLFDGKLCELHFKLLILTGDVELLAYFMARTDLGKYAENIKKSSSYKLSYRDAVSLFSQYHSIDLVYPLIESNKVDMLNFLTKSYPELFIKSGDSFGYGYCAKEKGLTEFADFMASLNNAEDLGNDDHTDDSDKDDMDYSDYYNEITAKNSVNHADNEDYPAGFRSRADYKQYRRDYDSNYESSSAENSFEDQDEKDNDDFLSGSRSNSIKKGYFSKNDSESDSEKNHSHSLFFSYGERDGFDIAGDVHDTHYDFDYSS